MSKTPRILPGFYWDASRNRYFPSSSKLPEPPGQPSATSSVAATSANPRNPVLLFNERIVKSTILPTIERKHRRRLRFSQLAKSKVKDVQTLPLRSITALSVYKEDDTRYQMAGDSVGWIYSTPEVLPSLHDPFPLQMDVNLGSQITATRISERLCIATSFGPDPKIFVQPIRSSSASIIKPGRAVHDIRTAELDHTSCCLGAQKGAFYIPDLDRPELTSLPVQSDVFALHYTSPLIYTGARNGSVNLFDLRTPLRTQNQSLLNGRHSKMSSSIMHLDILHEWELFIGGTNHQLDIFDLRFIRDSVEPVVTFPAYVNSYMENLPIVYDPNSDAIIASNQDCRIRAWMARDGTPLMTMGGEGIFEKVYEEIVSCLDVVSRTGEKSVLYIGVGCKVETCVLE